MLDMSGLLETNFNLASKILFRRNGPARLRNFQAMSFPLQYLSARHVFMLFFFVVSVLFWSFFSFVSLFCFSFPFVYFSIFSNPGWHASLFESSNLAKCFQICRASHTYDLLHVALAKNNDAIDRKWNCTSLAMREITRKIGHWALHLLTLILKCKCGYFFVIFKLMSDVRKCFYKCIINVIIIIIQSKYFSVSYWLKSHA